MYDLNYKESGDKFQKLVLLFYKSSLGFSSDDVPEMSWSAQKEFLMKTVYSSRLQRYPANKKFSQLFFKKIIDNLNSPHGVHDDFYTFLCSVMSNDSVKETFSFRHYVINNNLNNVITIKETNNLVVNGTTGLKTWESALMLTDWALCNQKIFKTKNVLELGSGVGLTGIAIAKLCDVQSMLLSDHHHKVIETIHENIRINFPQADEEETDCKVKIFKNDSKEIGVMQFDWNDLESFSSRKVPDIIIGADIIYDPSILKPLCNVFQYFFRMNNKLEIIVQSEIRKEDTFDKFIQFLDDFKFKVENIVQEVSVNIEWDQNIKRNLLKITCIYE